VDVSQITRTLENPEQKWAAAHGLGGCCDAMRCDATKPKAPHPPKPVAVRCAVRCCSLFVLVRGGRPRNRSVNVMAGQVGNSACAVRGISVATVHASAPPVHSAPTAVIATIDRGRGARPLSILCTNRLQKGQAAS